MNERAQDSLWDHPSPLLAKYHRQKNVTETDLISVQTKWGKQLSYTAENPCCIKYRAFHCSSTDWQLVLLEAVFLVSCLKSEWLLCWYILWRNRQILKWGKADYFINTKKVRLSVIPLHIPINGWRIRLSAPYCKSVGTRIRAPQGQIIPNEFLGRLQGQGSVLV